MKAIKTVVVAVLAASVPLTAMASADLAKAKGCLACHNVDKKLIGPGYKDVAVKYKGNKTAEAMLVQSIMKGSTGKWGPMPMPPNNVTEADAKTLAKWILSL